jgi:5,10-methylenetetrahydromethanopterin reductase
MSAHRLPRFGIRLSGGLAPQQCLALARAAEDTGFASVWFAENPLQRGVLPTAGACAAATARLRIGTGAINPFTRHPVQIAMDFAALAELSGGRAVLGIGSGIVPPIRRMGLDNARPVSAAREAIAIIRALLAGEAVGQRGRVFNLDNVRLGFQPNDLPIYMAAAGARALQACGESADGLIVSNLTPPRSTERLVETVSQAARRAGRPKPAIVQYVPCAVGEDRAAARETVKAQIAEMLTSFWPASGDWPPWREAVVAESGIGRADFTCALDRLRHGVPAATALDDRFVAAFALAGTAGDCLRQAACYCRAGADELALTFAGDGARDDIAELGRALAAAMAPA